MNNKIYSKPKIDFALTCDACFEEILPEDLELLWIEDNEFCPKKIHNFFIIHHRPCNSFAHAHIKMACPIKLYHSLS